MGGAHDFQKPVVIKKILPHLSADPNFVSMFIDEAKITAKLQHPKIVQVFELGTTGGELFIAMEFVDGIDLLKLLRFHARRGRRIPEQFAVHIAHEVLDALEHAHSAEDENGAPMCVVHRDVSPGNVLISKRGAVKLTDFGIARAAARNQKTEAGTLKGKYGYMSPEQVVNAAIDGRSDLFAVGVVLAEMLMGKRLFSAPSDLDVLLMVRDVNLERLVRFGSHIDRDLLNLVRKALTMEPNDRLQTAAEFRDLLADWLFDRRHRVAPKHLSQLVVEVRAGGVLGLDQSAKGTPVLSGHGGGAGPSTVTPVTAVTSPPSSKTSSKSSASEASEASAKSADASSADSEPVSDVQISWRAPIERVAAGSKQLTSVTPADLVNDLSSDYPLIDPTDSLKDPGSFSHITNLTGEHAVARGSEKIADGARPRRSSTSPLGDALTEAAERAAFERDLETSASNAAEAIDDILSEEPLFQPIDLDANSDASAEEPSEQLDGDELDGDSIELAIDFFDSADSGSSSDEEIVLDESDTSAEEAPQQVPLEDLDSQVIFADPKPLDALPDRGELGHLTSLALFANLVRRKVTGRLALVLEPTHKEIYFIDGEPKYVSSNVASERLGEFLRRKGVISEGELSMALVMLPQFDNRLIATLVGLGLMDDSQAIHMMTQQVRAKLVDACGWEKGSYRFFEGEDIPFAWLPLPLDAFEVMGAAALNTSDDFIDGWAAWREERVPQLVNPPPVPVDSFRNGSEIAVLLRRLNGRRTLGELRDETRGDDEWRRMCRLMLLLTEVGFIRVIRL